MKRLTMRKIREALRLHASGLSTRKIATSLGVGQSTASEYLKRIERAALTWPLAAEMTDAKLEALLFHPVGGASRQLSAATFRDAPSSTKAMAKSRRDMRPSFTRPDCLRKSEASASSRVILTVIPTSLSVEAIESDFHQIGNPGRVRPLSRWYEPWIGCKTPATTERAWTFFACPDSGKTQMA